MSAVSVVILGSSFLIGYVFKETGVPIPGVGPIDIFGAFVKDVPQSGFDLALENYSIWAICYFTAHFLMYVEPQKSLLRPFKLNPNYPAYSLVLKEILRSIRGKDMNAQVVHPYLKKTIKAFEVLIFMPCPSTGPKMF